MHKIDLESETAKAKDPVLDDTKMVEDNQKPIDAVVDSTVTKNPVSAQMPMTKKTRSYLGILLAVVAIMAGIGTGYGSHRLFASGSSSGPNDVIPVSEGSIKAGDVFGSQDDAFKDRAEGYLEKGGMQGEGSHKLLRPGGEAQTVYLTSSVTDLDALVGMEIEVWGETFKGQKAGWLMDVGKIKVKKVNAEAPITE